MNRLTTRRNSLHNALHRLFSQTVRIPLPPTDSHRLDGFNMPTELEITHADMLALYRRMQLYRRMETSIDQLYKNQEIRGFCHLYDGQEAVLGGIESVLTHEDPIITSYRDHCHPLTRGGDVLEVVAELMGRQDGNAGGKGGSMHMYNKKANFYGGAGIVGAQIPVGTGLAFALKYNQKKNVSCVMYGDGASNQGQLFEAANIAKLWKLPVIYLIENNQYGMGTSTSRSSSNNEYYTRGDSIPGVRMDGMNVFHVQAVVEFCKQYAIEHGPIYCEAKTYRYHGHSMSDPGLTYRTRDEVQQVRKNQDPVDFVKKTMIEMEVATEKEIKAMDKEIKKEVDQAVEQSRASPFPDTTQLYADVYYDQEQHYIRGVEVEQSIKPGNIKGTY